MEKRKIFIIVAIIIIVVVVAGFIFIQSSKPNKLSKQTQKNEEPVAMPTVDSSVNVELVSTDPGKEVLLKIQNILSNTNTIEYELSYLTAKQGLQGVIGTITILKEKNYEKKLTLGTCSSGTCVYHQVVGKIKVTLKFNGDYGEKLFEKEYEL